MLFPPRTSSRSPTSATSELICDSWRTPLHARVVVNGRPPEVSTTPASDVVAEIKDAGGEAIVDYQHPDIDIRWRRLTFFLTTHDAGGVTVLDLEMAHSIDELISEQLRANGR